MNATSSSGGALDSENIGGFGYGIGVSLGILLLITTITLAFYYCTRTRTNSNSTSTPAATNFAASPEEVGLDEATLTGYPKLLYSDVKRGGATATSGGGGGGCCSICLADYKGADELRLLPDCGHLFHLKCVDPWLRLHPTCPLCRTSPLPTPSSTPLVEVVPPSSRPIG